MEEEGRKSTRVQDCGGAGKEVEVWGDLHRERVLTAADERVHARRGTS